MFGELERVYEEVRAARLESSREEWLEGLRAKTLLLLASRLARSAGLWPETLGDGWLALLADGADLSGDAEDALARAVEFASARFPADRFDLAHVLGAWLDRMAALDARASTRSKTSRSRANSGSFFTPGRLAREVIESAAEALLRPPAELRILDPAAGGGAFLLEAARFVFERSGGGEDERRRALAARLYGVDVSRLACATLEAALHLALALPTDTSLLRTFVGCGDALSGAPVPKRGEVAAPGGGGFDFGAFGGEADGESGFDWIVGNPPWVAYQGRATRPLPLEQRRYYRARYRAFSGYPTLQAMFVERAAELAPKGVVTLLLPSSLADLEGYAAMRESLTETHEPHLPLVEFGEDAFDGVVQPCFSLVAVPRASAGPGSRGAWALREKQRVGEAEREEVGVPDVLVRLREGARLPAELFGELGFQSNRVVTEKLLSRTGASARFSFPLLEGKDVREFAVREPRVYLDPDRSRLAEAGVRLRAESDYRKAKFVIRQTAAFPIAALHTGLPFRNSLLAGFESDEYPAPLLVALLNSTLLRAYHLASQRDARQRTFPQLKVAHLRRLPAPLVRDDRIDALASLARGIAARGLLENADRTELDALVFSLYRVTASEEREVRAYFATKTERS